MKRKQNTVPTEFLNFYQHLLKLKMYLQKSTDIPLEQINNGVVLLHYATFFINELYRHKQIESDKPLLIRTIVEEYQTKNYLDAQAISKIISFIDLVGKELNLSNSLHIHIALYDSLLNAQIYLQLNNLPENISAAYLVVFDENSISQLKRFYDASKIVISQFSK